MQNKKKKPAPKTPPLGLKFDNNKPMVDLIPYEFIEEVGKVLSFGAKKYRRSNWAKGIHWSRLLAATTRHLGKFNKLEDYDDESKLLHLSHAATNLAFLIWHYYNRPDLDDRWLKELNDSSVQTKRKRSTSKQKKRN